MSEKRSIQNLSLDGNCLCFNFINTVHSRVEGEEPFEYLSSYEKLMEWCRRLEVMPPKRIQALAGLAGAHPQKEKKALADIVDAREMLYGFFSDIAAEKPVVKDELNSFNKQLSGALKNLRFVSDDTDLQLDWEETSDLKEPLWRVMKSAYDILTEEDFDRIKECEACGWVFLDQSKNKSRRWCSMESCGSIHKAKKYYHRKKKEKSGKD